MKGQIRALFSTEARAKLEDSASVEGFLSVWGFNGEQWQFVMATGGCG